MYLKRIELQGFKSFAGKTVLEFHKGITSVVGPNGSGKSNIADAVRWVLGEQSAKQLRGSKMFDVIFSGTQYRKSVGFADVTLVIDNEEGRLPIDYSEVSITRRLYRSGDSEFSINGNQCRLKDIRDLFLDTGVGRDGYSIISQGKIQEILSVKSEDRRGIFEEAAGIMKYKVRKIEAQRKLERTEQNLLRIGDIVNELKHQMGPLEEQSIKAREFIELREVLQKNEVGLYLNNLKNFNSRLEKYELDMESLRSDIELQEKELEQASLDNTERIKKQHELEESEENARAVLNEFLMSVETKRHEVQIARERLNSIIAGRERARREVLEIEEKKKQLARDYSRREEQIEYLKKQQTVFEEKLDDKRKVLDAILVTLGEKEKQMEMLREQLDDMVDRLSEVRIKMRSAELEGATIDDSITSSFKTQQELIIEKDSFKLKAQDSGNDAAKITREANEVSSRLSIVQEDIASGNTEIEKLRSELGAKRTRLGILESSLKILEDMEKRMEGYSGTVKDLIEESGLVGTELTGIRGVAARMISVENGFEQALEAALGNYVQAIVTDDKKSIGTAIGYLKEQNKGRASFIPGKNEVTVMKDTSEKLRDMPGFMGTISDRIKGDPVIIETLKSILSGVIVVDNYANATALWEKGKGIYAVATLEGDFLGSDGVITGGSASFEKAGLINRENKIRETRKQADSIGKDIEELDGRLKKSVNDVAELSSEEKALREKLNDLNVQKTRKEAEATAALAALEGIKGRIESLEKSILTSKERKKAIQSEIETLRTGLAEQEKQISEIRNSISASEMSHQEDRKNRDELHLDISDLKVSLNSVVESLGSSGESMDRIETEREELDSKKELTLVEIKEFDDTEKRLIQDIETREKAVSNPEEEQKRLEGILNGFVRGRRALEEESNRHVDRVNEINKEILQLQNKYSKVEVNQAKTVSEIDAMKNRMWDEYGLTHNEALGKHTEIENISEARNEINRCRKRIKELGPVNVNAIDDYARTRERYDFLSVQQADLNESKEDLYKVIREMNTIMKKTFKEQLEIINERFDKVFVELFEGGKARVELVDENDILESGIDIIVQPPGKKLQNMMLLSGGEKAFTAIALVFAILDINPSPFCIFDEIEAALDETNVWKFGEYVKNYRHKTQFIMITHRKGTMEHSDSLYGVTMQEHGISKVVSMSMTD
ncbi:MAG TPA: chromosome segregation protein SMC [Clostridia bacterium]|nr:chromosome segregation protein SMC [Clostridia bacterium]